jgi:NADPH:quinone reductase-like Zn-dependent oxidoreductase
MLRGRAIEEKIAATRAFEDQVVPLFERRIVRAVVDREFPLEDVHAAHMRMESNESIGKIVLRVT